MSIDFMDDFTGYGTDGNRVNRMADGIWAEIAWIDLIADPDPLAGGAYVVSVQGNAASHLRKVLRDGVQTTMGVAARYWFTAIPIDLSVIPIIAQFADNNNVSHCYVYVNPSGQLVAVRTDNAVDVVLGTSDDPVVTSNAWQHLETKCVLDPVNGSIKVRREGQTVFEVTGVRTTTNSPGANAYCSQVRWQSFRGGATPGVNMNMKDLIIWNGSGASNNDFIGTYQVYKIIPDGDVLTGWTPSTGATQYNLIDETTPDDDGEYLDAAGTPLPGPSQFTMTDLPVDVTSVKGVQINHRSRKTDGGDCQLQVSAVSGPNTGDGADRTITVAYAYYNDVFDKDPSGSNWSKALVDALKVTIDRTV